MVCRVSADEDHVAFDGRRLDGHDILQELDAVDSAALGVRHNDGLVLCEVGGCIGPPLNVRGNLGYCRVSYPCFFC
jgi:hypothetical protein